MNTQCGTDAKAAPGAQTVTPERPSWVGPLEVQVYSIDFPKPVTLYLASG